MLDLLARFISFAFNPYFLLAPIPYLLVVRETSDPRYAIKWTFISFLFVAIVVLFVLYCIKKGYFSDLDISKREQRPLWFLFAAITSLVYVLALLYLQGPKALFIVAGGIIVSVLVFSIVNTKVKASIHVASIAALVFSLSILYSSVFLLLLVMIPVIIWSRVRIKRHTLNEALVGGTMGVVITILFYIIFKMFFNITLSA